MTPAMQDLTPARAYGGVVIDERGCVLLREPRNHFGGYVWTYPKGRPEPCEAPEAAARREVEEETGVRAEVVARLPGAFPGTTTDTVFFLMAPVGEAGGWNEETQAIRWADRAEARRLIGQTYHEAGRQRDLAILDAAFRCHDERQGATRGAAGVDCR